jgi:hypothetical protein
LGMTETISGSRDARRTVFSLLLRRVLVHIGGDEDVLACVCISYHVWLTQML